MFTVYTCEEISSLPSDEAVGKYVSVQGVVYRVDSILSNDVGEKEQKRRLGLPRYKNTVELEYLIKCLDDKFLLCKRLYL